MTQDARDAVSARVDELFAHDDSVSILRPYEKEIVDRLVEKYILYGHTCIEMYPARILDSEDFEYRMRRYDEQPGRVYDTDDIFNQLMNMVERTHGWICADMRCNRWLYRGETPRRHILDYHIDDVIRELMQFYDEAHSSSETV